jgi:hypothetical protein
VFDAQQQHESINDYLMETFVSTGTPADLEHAMAIVALWRHRVWLKQTETQFPGGRTTYSAADLSELGLLQSLMKVPHQNWPVGFAPTAAVASGTLRITLSSGTVVVLEASGDASIRHRLVDAYMSEAATTLALPIMAHLDSLEEIIFTLLTGDAFIEHDGGRDVIRIRAVLSRLSRFLSAHLTAPTTVLTVGA